VADAARHLVLLAAVLTGSIMLIGLQSRSSSRRSPQFCDEVGWNFHRNMLAQSTELLSDEFAGRVAAKLMQTALASADTWMILAESWSRGYLISSHCTGRRQLPSLAAGAFMGWLAIYGMPSGTAAALGRCHGQADARRCDGRITDAYTNITTVKLFSLTNARRATCRLDGRVSADRVSTDAHGDGLRDLNHALSMGLIASRGSHPVAMDSRPGRRRRRCAATAMALRLMEFHTGSCGKWPRCSSKSAPFRTASRRWPVPHRAGRPRCQPLRVTRGDIRFEAVTFAYGAAQNPAAP